MAILSASSSSKHDMTFIGPIHRNVFSIIVECRFNAVQYIDHDITYGVAMIATKRKSDFKITIDTPYLVLTSELWGVYCEDLGENWPRYDGTHSLGLHEDVIKWKHFQRYWSFVRGIHRSPVDSIHTGQWRGTLVFSLICAWLNASVINREAGDLSRHRESLWRHCY